MSTSLIAITNKNSRFHAHLFASKAFLKQLSH